MLVSSVVISAQTKTLISYDILNRLTQITYANGTVINYTFDELGNRLSKIVKTATVLVAASANPTAGGSITGAGSYTVGQSCTLAATANTGYSFVNWTENGSVVSTTASYTFSVAGARTLVANFVQNALNYTISSSASPSAGGTVTGNGTYTGGSSCIVTATANTGYTFVNWTENGTQVSTTDSYEFTVGGNRTLVANFTQNPISYTISASSSPSIGGSITGSGSYINGTVCTLTATANTGYTFANWTENAIVVSTSANYTFTVTKDSALIANFVQDTAKYTVSVSAYPIIGGIAGGGGSYQSGNNCTVTATSGINFTFANWTDNKGTTISTSAVYTFTVTKDTTLIANFTYKPVNTCTISMSVVPIAGGTTSGGGSYFIGDVCTVMGTPNSGYTFTNWTENGTVVSTSASYTFTISTNRVLTANFTLNTTENSIVVSFKRPDDWGVSDVYLWAWTPAGINLFSAWPGVVMTNNGNGWYSYTFNPSITDINVIFSKSGTPQTVDITGVTQSTCYQSAGLSGAKITVSAVSCLATGLDDNITRESLLKVYPNPTQTFLRISSTEIIKRIEVCDIAGRIIYNNTINSDSYSLNVNDLLKGIYLIKGFTDKGIITRRFIKE